MTHKTPLPMSLAAARVPKRGVDAAWTWTNKKGQVYITTYGGVAIDAIRFGHTNKVTLTPKPEGFIEGYKTVGSEAQKGA